MAQFDLTIHYLKGERNVVADALSCRGDVPTEEVVSVVSTTSLDRSLVLDILTGYMEDPFCIIRLHPWITGEGRFVVPC